VWVNRMTSEGVMWGHGTDRQKGTEAKSTLVKEDEGYG
jgi:hypothetical protein